MAPKSIFLPQIPLSRDPDVFKSTGNLCLDNTRHLKPKMSSSELTTFPFKPDRFPVSHLEGARFGVPVTARLANHWEKHPRAEQTVVKSLTTWSFLQDTRPWKTEGRLAWEMAAGACEALATCHQGCWSVFQLHPGPRGQRKEADVGRAKHTAALSPLHLQKRKYHEPGPGKHILLLGVSRLGFATCRVRTDQTSLRCQGLSGSLE